MAERKTQLCWTCRNACGNGCCWFRDGVPIKGWDAVPTKVKSLGEDGKTRCVDSFLIVNCPQYLEDENDKKLTTKELAKILKVTQRTIFRWKQDKIITLEDGEYLFNGQPIIRRKNVR